LFPRPGTDGHGVDGAGPAATAGTAPTGSTADLAGMGDVLSEDLESQVLIIAARPQEFTKCLALRA
jgi:hypothetical protein